MRGLLGIALFLVGCDALGPSRVESGVVTSVTVERLDLDRRWDGGLFSENPPDVYVDVKSSSAPSSGLFGAAAPPLFRSRVVENLEPGQLPLTVYTEAGTARIALTDSVWVNVSDRDGTFDDLMLTTGRFSLGDLYDGAGRGALDTFRFESEDGALQVRVRWDEASGAPRRCDEAGRPCG